MMWNVCVMLVLVHCCSSQLYDKYEDDECELENGEIGICVRLSQCESAIELVQLRKHPIHCSFIRFTPIVCCPITENVNTRISELKCLEYQILNKTEPKTKTILSSPLSELNPETSFLFDISNESRERINEDEKITLDVRSTFADLAAENNISLEETSTVYIKFNYSEDTSIKVQDPLNISVAITKVADPVLDELIYTQLPGTPLRNENFKPLVATKISVPPEVSVTPEVLETSEISVTSETVTTESTRTTRYVDDGNIEDDPNFVIEFPHIVAIGYPKGSKILWQCTGTLVSEKFVLTAAHCLNLLDFGIPEYISFAYLPQLIPIVTTIPHPSYRPSFLYHNIGLVQFSYSLVFTPTVRPACLYSFENEPQISLSQVSGSVEELRDVSVDFIAIEECEKTYQEIGNKRDLESILCGKYNTKDSCNNSFGGPLQIKIDSGNSIPEYSIIGITSNSVQCILDIPIPIVYIRISHYVSWLESIIWPEE